MTTRLRIIYTLLLAAVFACFSAVWSIAAPVYEVDAALGQIENSDEAYTVGRLIASWNPTFWIGVLAVTLALCIWVPVGYRAYKRLSEETNA